MIGLELVTSLQNREIKPDREAAQVWGLDVARFGKDASALCIRQSPVIQDKIKNWRNLDIMQLTGQIKALWGETEPNARPSLVAITASELG